MLFDTLHNLLLRQLLAIAGASTNRHCVPVALLQVFSDEDFELLLVAELVHRQRQLAEIVPIFVLELRLPKPLVNLVLFHAELLCQPLAMFTWRHQAFVLVEHVPEDVHLTLLLPVAILWLWLVERTLAPDNCRLENLLQRVAMRGLAPLRDAQVVTRSFVEHHLALLGRHRELRLKSLADLHRA